MAPSKVILDACVLYPTITRDILLLAAQHDQFVPYWSLRILEEWRRAAAKLGPDQAAFAQGEIALLNARWPDAIIDAEPLTQAGLDLPDANDVHVLASALTGRCPVIVTANLKDFPTRYLAELGVQAVHPDQFLTGFAHSAPKVMLRVVGQVHATAEQLSGQHWPLRKLLKKARLPRLGKAMENLR